MTAALDSILDALRARGAEPRRSGDGWQARCPSHEDDNPSLSIGVGDSGKVLLHCYAGCEFGAILGALDLPTRELSSDSGHRGNDQTKVTRRIVKTYDYINGAGELLMQACRTEGGRKFVRRPDGNGGWINSVKGVPRILYRLPDLLKVPRETLVFIVEGEKDVDTLRVAGLVATCNPFGAGSWSWLDDDSALEGRHIVILPDNDDPGRKHAQDIASRLFGRAASVKLVELPDLPSGGDVTDWLEAGGDPEDLDRLAAAASEWEPTPEPPLSPYPGEKESMAGLRAAARISEDQRLGAMRLCDQVAEWFARRGPQTLGKDFPIPYAAAALGVTRVHLYRLRDVGRVRLALSCNPVGYNFDDTTDRALRPLTPLLDRSPDEIGPAWGRAQGMADEDAAEKAQRNGRQPPKRARVEARHVRQAIGGDGGGEKIPCASTPSQIVRRIATCFEAVSATPDVPRDVLRPLRTSRDNARTWARGGDR